MIEGLREMDNEELATLRDRLATLEAGHEIYGKTAADYGPTLSADLDVIDAEIKRRSS